MKNVFHLHMIQYMPDLLYILIMYLYNLKLNPFVCLWSVKAATYRFHDSVNQSFAGSGSVRSIPSQMTISYQFL